MRAGRRQTSLGDPVGRPATLEITEGSDPGVRVSRSGRTVKRREGVSDMRPEDRKEDQSGDDQEGENRACRECGGPMAEDWRLHQGDPNNALCEKCWRNSHWGPVEARGV